MTVPDTPLSARNPSVQHVRRLARRRTARSEAGQYIIEGPVLVIDAVAAGVPIDEAYVADDARPGDELSLAVKALEGAGVTVRRLAAGVLPKVADSVQPHDILAVASGHPMSVERFLQHHPTGLVVVLVDVADPGNAGTLVRTAEATGAAGVVFVGDSVDPVSPKVVRASAGSAFRVDIAHDRDVGCVERLRGAGFRLVGTTPVDGVDYTSAPLEGDVALLLGSEAHGLEPALVEMLDDRVAIPMGGAVESLNVAVAGSLLCFEYLRRRPA